ncbi:PAS domain S-box protein [Flavobacterium sp. ZT3R18]|uniref:PAS domain S-box protein n=1 Tax=Flavobacterium sp. ZT3R18 TaxID=2594429 RepID=UPI00117A39CC|nr:PAS domain S-box protein [Flavobacterium sp. ZT3R18]TRX36988.1 PAS domain S-box protein [Flavobacterium sp. ZT3R18]
MKENRRSVEELLQKTKKLELELLKLQKKEDSIVNFEFFTRETSDFICVTDFNTYFKKFNPAFVKKLGYSKRELLQHSYLKCIHPEDIAQTNEVLQKLLQGTTSVNFENRILKKNGEYFLVQWTTIINLSKKLIYAIGRDITEIKKIQEKLIASESLLNDAQKIAKIGSWEFNLVSNALIWSDELFRIFEISKGAEDDLYANYLSRFTPEDKEVLDNKINESIASKKPYEIIHKVLLPKNRFKWVYGTGVPVVNENGDVIALRGVAQDITEKKRIEDEIIAKEKEVAAIKEKKREQESNAKFRNYVENAPEGVFVANEKGCFLEVNPAATKITGFSKSRLLKMSLQDLTPPASIASVIANLETLLQKGALNVIMPFAHKNGTICSWSIDAVKLSETQVLLFAKDVTERIQIIEALREKEERFRILVENAPEALVVMDMEQQKFVTVSQSALVLFKMTERELLQVGPIDLSPEYQPNGMLSAELAEKKISEAIAGGKPTFEWIHLDSEGKPLFCDVRLVRLPDENKTLIRASIIDITERKSAEERLKESELFLKETQIIAELGTYSINMTTGNWTHTDLVNSIFGIDSSYDLNSKKWLSIVHPAWRKIMIDYLLDEVVGKKMQFNKEYKIIRVNDNEERWVHALGTLKWDKNNQPQVIVGAIRDITERKLMEMELISAKEKAEENEKDLLTKYIEYEEINDKLKQTNKELTKAKQQAEEANKAKSNFLSNMSHEIRTPLNGIVGFTDLLMKTNLEKNQLEYMSTINVSANSLMEIINDILDFSKIESGKLELHIEQTDLYDLLHQVIDLFKHQANLKNIDLSLNIGDKVPQYIYADSIRFKQILVNLISNALKFTSFGYIRLDVDLVKMSKKDKSTIRFSIKDSGIGIKQYNQKKIFNSFVQEDNATSKKFGGTGLGLAISNLLLELMDSSLHLESKYGDGSDFFFAIKLKNASPIKTAFIELTNQIIQSEVNRIKNSNVLKVLIVEDNTINLFLAKTLVKRIIPNVIIFEARDGNEGIAQFELHRPDLILMDVQMPIKNGYEATLEIRKLKKAKNTPIIALTAGIMVGEKDKCLEYGMNDYVSKPIIESDLEAILHKWLPQ